MSDASTRPGTDDLQFDRAVDPSAAAGTLVCSKCNSPIRMYYYHVNGETTCSTCKAAIDRAGGGAGASKAGSGLGKAALFGLGAAIAGAVIYFAVMEYMELEIGIVAILIGYMVGHSVRKAIRGNGGRRFQVLAAGLTYLAVALAYSPFAIRGMLDPNAGVTADSTAAATTTDSVAATTPSDPANQASVAADSSQATATTDDATTATVAADSATAAAVAPVNSFATDSTIVETGELGAGGIALGIAGILVFIIALPIIGILGSMPSGLISAVIIGIGMLQAWNMTGGQELTVTGPFKVGTEPPPATS